MAAGDPLLEGTQGLPDPAHEGQVPPPRPAAWAGQPAPLIRGGCR